MATKDLRPVHHVYGLFNHGAYPICTRLPMIFYCEVGEGLRVRVLTKCLWNRGWLTWFFRKFRGFRKSGWKVMDLGLISSGSIKGGGKGKGAFASGPQSEALPPLVPPPSQMEKMAKISYFLLFFFFFFFDFCRAPQIGISPPQCPQWKFFWCCHC